MRIALYQPDIPQNAGATFRLAACMALPVDVIEPTGFIMSDANLRRAGMDYLDQVDIIRHLSWDTYLADTPPARLVLLTTTATERHVDFTFDANDTLMVGRESSGVPDKVHDRADARLLVPMKPGTRSLNVVTALTFVVSEALRQTAGYPQS
ncbi:MAG: tRNA (cytidine(34)-2'-O)-methyltransferase [Alphaproteobacteria bacterium]|jgi:tRNA (cytidine/uridine-2'-O-)-methyltransferase|nr:tRNA (cytidine(34)-2'-O)-methyltransferase [Alphaproteobacteria bacterium]